jgi:hypothetical protein
MDRVHFRRFYSGAGGEQARHSSSLAGDLRQEDRYPWTLSAEELLKGVEKCVEPES